jgi:hypothetical protein
MAKPSTNMLQSHDLSESLAKLSGSSTLSPSAILCRVTVVTDSPTTPSTIYILFCFNFTRGFFEANEKICEVSSSRCVWILIVFNFAAEFIKLCFYAFHSSKV